MPKINLLLLEEVTTICFKINSSARYSLENRNKFYELAELLHARYTALQERNFAANSAKFQAAEAELGLTVSTLKATGANLQSIADRIEQVGKLISAIDNLLGLAAGVIV